LAAKREQDKGGVDEERQALKGLVEWGEEPKLRGGKEF